MGRFTQTLFVVCTFLLYRSAFCSFEKTGPDSIVFTRINHSPEVYVCENFLSPEECDAVIAQARPHLARSTVVDDGSSGNIIDYRRTSSGTFLPRQSEIDAVKTIRNLAQAVTGIPERNGEAIQVSFYGVGAEYQPHYDYFDIRSAGGAFHYSRGGQRTATLIVYLNTTEKGGQTVFPKAGLKVAPQKGKAVLFYNVNERGETDPASLHGGAPVLAGEKWIATLWMREAEFR